MKGWGINIPYDIFTLIPFWDSRDVARSRRVCVRWRDAIDRIEKLVHMKSLHVARLQTPSNELCDTIFEGYIRPRPKKIKEKAFSKICSHLLWEQHQYNAIAISWIGIPDLFSNFGYPMERVGYYIEQNSGDIIMVNNFYGRLDNHESMRQLSDIVFPGSVDWKFISYPFDRFNRQEIDIYGSRFHRGSSLWLRIRNRGASRNSTKAANQIGKRLRKDDAARSRELAKKWRRGVNVRGVEYSTSEQFVLDRYRNK